jgi:Mrp family chromosome partitioning ATPase
LEDVDAPLISSLVEQTFLLISAGQTTRMQAKKAQEQLQLAHAKLAGIVMLDG